MSDYENVSLSNLGNGAAIELFDEQFKKILANIADPNTKANAVRKVCLTVSIKPDDERRTCEILIACNPVFGPDKLFRTTCYVDSNGKQPVAFEASVPRAVQQRIDGETDTKVVLMKNENK